ncbi:MAG: glycoside hydrolase family 38 C-terminal domain-containing protein, partial [Candidatus Thorarchaeota archaeon]
MRKRWSVNLVPMLHFENSGLEDYEHNIGIASWNLKNMLDQLEAEPELRLAVDQVTLLEGFRRLFPNYWDLLHQMVLDGRVEVVGGTYVMPDLIIPDGESIVRQFLLGTQFVRQELGVEVKTGWMIDSAGHCSQMPQILRQCGINSYFFWRGMTYRCPSEFMWRGVDGSKVITVWLRNGYDCLAWLSEDQREAITTLLELVERTGEISASPNVFIPLGGGLVPLPANLSDTLKHWNLVFPEARISVLTPREFIDKLLATQSNLATISGPLTSERFVSVHPGGLSSRSVLKILSRTLEGLLYLLELYLSLARDHQCNTELANLWRVLLFNHDHNIIRGLIADEPYLQARKRFQDAINRAEMLLESAVRAAASLGPSDDNRFLTVLNPVLWVRDGIVRVQIDLTQFPTGSFEIQDEKGNSVPYQIVEQQEGSVHLIFCAKDVPSVGMKRYRIVPADKRPDFESSIKTGENWIESADFVLEFDELTGSLTRLYDKKNNFDVLRDAGNCLIFEPDLGDLHRHSGAVCQADLPEASTVRTPAQVRVRESGPVRAAIEVNGTLKGSEWMQRVFIYDGLHRVDIETDLDFRGRNTKVCVSFPLTVFSDRVEAGSQFGSEQRVLWDISRGPDARSPGVSFAALDWVDCNGPEYGIGLIAFGLHEFRMSDGELRLTLLRSVDQYMRGDSSAPPELPMALDQGLHSFRYSLVPHSTDSEGPAVWRAAAEHRLPLICVPACPLDSSIPSVSHLSVSGVELMLSCFKPTDRQDEYIVRLFEPAGREGVSRLTFSRPVRSVVLTDLCERDVGPL